MNNEKSTVKILNFPERVAAIISKTSVVTGDNAKVPDGAALAYITDLLNDIDRNLIERGKRKKVSRQVVIEATTRRENNATEALLETTFHIDALATVLTLLNSGEIERIDGDVFQETLNSIGGLILALSAECRTRFDEMRKEVLI